MGRAPGPCVKRVLVLQVLLGFFAAKVGSQLERQEAQQPGQRTCKWQHNGTSSGYNAARDTCQVEELFSHTSVQEECTRDQKWSFKGEVVAGRFIVRFKEYRMAEEHSAALSAALGSKLQWKVIHRDNAAARFPTDFALVEIDLTVSDSIQGQLLGLPFVKDIHPEQRVTRSLVWASQEDCEIHSGSLCDLGPHQHINKRPGRFSTKPSQGLHNNEVDHSGGNRKLKADRSSVVSMLQADLLWKQGFRGELVKMGVFDTGIRLDHPHVKNIRERTNWTHEPTLEDGLGHGTFVAGVIGGTDASCPGFAPEVELYTFRVFTNDQVSYTSWFLDAFNYAIGTEMNVVNLSIGGPDYLDLPFVEKVWEITSSGILMVSAIGNDGPLYGTLNNPADQNDVIGVGGIDYADKIASFSSRGMSTWEIPRGYGRAKPDVVAYGRDVMGSRIQGGCRSLSGTSVASPVIAGAVCLLASTVPAHKRWHFSGGILNPASMKQALVEGAKPIPGITMYEQGQGKLDLVKSKEILESYTPRASVVPGALDFRQCPFLWPFCRQPIYAHAMPLMFNATVLNGLGLTGKFEAEPLFSPLDDGGKYLDVRFEHSDLLWPWSGFLALYIYVRPEGAAFNGTASGEVSFTIVTPPMPGESGDRRSLVKLPLTVSIIPTPSREKRVLWDQFHSLRYPPAYLPRDSLDVRNDILDWHGDHPHTNYHDMYDSLRDAGYFLEVLGSPFSCFDASQYGALLVVDSEEEFYEEELAKLHRDVEQHGLGLIVFAEWYNVDTMVKMRFFDDNTRSWWTPVTGGANIPAVNDLLGPFGIAFGDALLEGQLTFGEEKLYYASGVNIVRFPAGGTLHAAQLADKAVIGLARASGPYGAGGNSHHAVLGFAEHGAGRLAVYGDSNCLDSSHQRSSCSGMLQKAIQYVAEGKRAPELFPQNLVLANDLGSADMELPKRRLDVDLTPFSTVLSHPLLCYPNAPVDFELVTIPHRGSSHQSKVSVVKKIREQPVVTNLLPLNTTTDSTTRSPPEVVAAPSGALIFTDSSTTSQATTEGIDMSRSQELKRFLPVDDAHTTSQTAEQAADLSNEASKEDASFFLGSEGVQSQDTSAEEKTNGEATVSQEKTGIGQTGSSDAVSASARQQTGPLQSVVEAAEQRQKVKAEQEAKAKAEHQQLVERQTQQDAQPLQLPVQALEQPGSKLPDVTLPKVDLQSTLPQPKTAKYDSINPLESNANLPAERLETGRKEVNYLEIGAQAEKARQWAIGEAAKEQASYRPSGGDPFIPQEASGWRQLAGSFGAFPQVLAVAGVIGIFVLWHVRQRRRAQEGSPLRERGNSTRVVTLGILGVGADTSSMKSRQRATLERSPTLGR